jgi:hypothetical protein
MSRAGSIRMLVAWLLLAVTVVYLLSGFGISNQEIVGPLTGGLLGKALAFRLHDVLWLPFLALLVLHVAWNVGRRAKIFN